MNRFGWIAAIVLCALAAQHVAASPTGGTSIVNEASATYSDVFSHAYQTTSNAIVSQVVSLSSLVVSPKQNAAAPASDTVAVNASATRVFTITNTSNITDAYRITSLQTGPLGVTSIAWITPPGSLATAVNGSASPQIGPGSSISVRVTLSTSGLNVGQSVPIALTAQTTVTQTGNGLAHDSGMEWVIGATGPHFSGPAGANTTVLKTVNNARQVQTQPGATVTFHIAALNSGGAAATNVQISDPVPAGLRVDLSSAELNGQPAGAQASLSGNTIVFRVPSIGAQQSVDATFNAILPPGESLGESFVNVATTAADGIPATATTPADVFSGSSNIVFDGFAGAGHPIAGAVIALLDANGKPVGINAPNPSVTGPDGKYALPLSVQLIPAAGAHFTLTISAPSYLNRRITLVITPTANGFYNVSETSADAQPIAAAGGFTLTMNNVHLQDVFGLFGNLPLFALRTISVTKTSDKQAASAGDRVIFTLGLQNQTTFGIANVRVVDTMQAGFAYLNGTARVDGLPLEPLVSGRTLSWVFSSIAPAQMHTITYGATIVPGVAAGSTLANSVSVNGSAAIGGVNTGASASTSVMVIDGVLSMRRVVTGRVFFDDAHRGYFVRGDRAISSVRVVLEDGSFAITDSGGAFSFPSVRPGLHVVRIDPLTLPASARAQSDAPMNSSRSYEQLLHGVLDDGTMEDVEFAVAPR